MLDFIYISCKELWGTGSKRKNQKSNKMSPVAIKQQPYASKAGAEHSDLKAPTSDAEGC